MSSLDNSIEVPMTESLSEAPMEASKNLLASPATPEQAYITKSRTHDYSADEAITTGSTIRTTTPATDADTMRNFSNTEPIHMLNFNYSQSSLETTHHQEGEIVDDITAATATATTALKVEISNLRQELARQATEYTQRLDAEHSWCQTTVQHASDVACSLRDVNITLTAEVDQLRARVVQLEFEAAEQLGRKKNSNGVNEDEQQGNEQLIAALQVEIGDLQRQLHKAHRARVAATETEEAALQRAEILAQQVEQMVNLLESERIEKEKLLEALKTACVLPSSIEY
jgi:chromosome segregation ATPase